MTKQPSPDLHRAYQDAAHWAEFRAQFVGERDNAIARGTPLGARLRIGALVTASVFAVLVSAVGIPQYLAQRHRVSDSVSLAAQSEKASKPQKSPNPPTTVPTSVQPPSKSVGPATVSASATAGRAVREISVVFTRKSATDSCGEPFVRARSVPASSPILAALKRLTQGPGKGEKSQGVFSALEYVPIETQREPKKIIVDLKNAPAETINPSCRTKQVDDVLRMTLKPLLSKNDTLVIRISGSESTYQKYLNPQAKPS